MKPAVLQLACSFWFSGWTQPALHLLQPPAIAQAQQISPNPEAKSAEEFYKLGVEFHRLRAVDAAIAAYQNAIRLDPTFDSAYINLGLALIQQGQLDQASEIFHQVLDLPDRLEDPASIHTVAHYNLAIILERQERTSEAIVEVQQALAITPNFELAQLLLQQLQATPGQNP